MLLLASCFLFSDSLGFHPGGLCLFAFAHMLAFFNKNENSFVQRILLQKRLFYRKLFPSFKWEDWLINFKMKMELCIGGEMNHRMGERLKSAKGFWSMISNESCCTSFLLWEFLTCNLTLLAPEDPRLWRDLFPEAEDAGRRNECFHQSLSDSCELLCG